MSDPELDLSIFTLVAAPTRCGARCVDHANGWGFNNRRGRVAAAPQSLRCARPSLPAVSLLCHFLSLLAGIDDWTSSTCNIKRFSLWSARFSASNRSFSLTAGRFARFARFGSRGMPDYAGAATASVKAAGWTSRRWQATWWPGRISRISGSSSEQRAKA